jgi:hypothetical protein
MIRSPKLPLTTAALPAQRLVEVVELPPEPDPFEVTVCLDAHPTEILPKRRPRNLTYLGMVEWAWSPLSSRLEACYLHRGRRHWIVYFRDPVPNAPDEAWRVAAHVPRGGIPADVAATYLLIARWRAEAEEQHLDRFHFVGEEGVFGVAHWHAIARAVWGPEGQGCGLAREDGQ